MSFGTDTLFSVLPDIYSINYLWVVGFYYDWNIVGNYCIVLCGRLWCCFIYLLMWRFSVKIGWYEVWYVMMHAITCCPLPWNGLGRFYINSSWLQVREFLKIGVKVKVCLLLIEGNICDGIVPHGMWDYRFIQNGGESLNGD